MNHSISQTATHFFNSLLGPHSCITTPSGGVHLVFAQPDPPITSRFRWCEGVEVLGSSSLLTCYDLEELAFPRVAPRAKLPRMFWQARDVSCERVPIKKTQVAQPTSHQVGDVTAAMWQLDPAKFREYFGWFALMTSCCFVGIARNEFIAWSTSDPSYATHAKQIGKMWDRLQPQHGGAFWAALSGAGIKLTHSAGSAVGSSLFNGHPLPATDPANARARREPTRNWRSRVNTVLDALGRKQDPDCLFWAGCRMAEVMIDTKKPALKVARALLEAACPNLRKAIGADEVSRIITNAFHEVEKDELVEGERG